MTHTGNRLPDGLDRVDPAIIPPMASQNANTVEGTAGLHEQSLPLRQWLLLLTGILMVAVPWWLGMLWIVGALS